MALNENPKQLLLLVDGSSYLYRAFHAMPDLRNTRGEPTGAIYGVVNMLRKLRIDYKPDRIAVVFDAPGGTFRDRLYADYKATRTAMPEDLARQIPMLHEVISALGIPMLMVPDVEADDVIGTLAAHARAANIRVVISTGDKDMAQLVGPDVTLINTMTGEALDSDGVLKRFGVSPAQIIDYLAIVGDKVDNVPGLAGVGPKTAARWLKDYGSIVALLAHEQDISGRVGETLRHSHDALALARDLVTIRCDVPLASSVADLVSGAIDREALRALYGRLEFKAWLSELKFQDAPTAPGAVILSDIAAVNGAVEDLRRAKRIALHLFFEEGGVAALVFGDQTRSYVVPVHGGLFATIDISSVCQALTPLLQDASLVVCDSKRFMRFLMDQGLTRFGVWDDVMLASYVQDSGAAAHDLATLALKYLGRALSAQALLGEGRARRGLSDLSSEDLAALAADTVQAILALDLELLQRLAQEPGLQAIYRDLERPLAGVLARIEAAGVPVDCAMLRAQSADLALKQDALEKQAYDSVGHAFNLNSPAQIQQILFEEQGLPVTRRTPKGQPSTAEEVLSELALDYPLPQLILDYRTVGKLKNTYTDKLPRMCDPRTGRIHTDYHQAVAATGRLSSSDPNLQNIPVRTEEGRRIRQAFVAGPGWRLLSADYSQIELRLMAHLSGDPGLVQAFREGRDVHQATAAEVFGVPLEDVTDEQRRAAKAINFGLMYGMSAFGLARQLRIDQGRAQDYCDLYFRRYPGVHAYMERMRAQARAQGYVETLFGRRLYVPDIKASHAARRQYAERTAINAPLQGTAADLIKMAMLSLDEYLAKAGLAARMIMQVHDELVFEAPLEEVETLKAQAVLRMEHVVELSVPLIVHCGVGHNWDEAH